MNAELARSVVSTLDSNGQANFMVGPERAREYWKITGYLCHAVSEKMPTLSVYMGSVDRKNLIDYTRRGLGDSSNIQIEMGPGEHLVFVWEAGTVGSQATVTISGRIETR